MVSIVASSVRAQTEAIVMEPSNLTSLTEDKSNLPNFHIYEKN